MSGHGADVRSADATIGRLMHALNRPEPWPRPDAATDSEAFTADEQVVIDDAERALADGLALQRWWQAADRDGSYRERFELQRAFNRPESSYGFFDEIPIRGTPMRLMGNVQELMYDNQHVPAALGTPVAAWVRDQTRMFVLRYFMRVSDFRQPESAEDGTREPPAAAPCGLDALSWCDRGAVLREGFGFTQLFYKLRTTGEIRRFPAEQASAIVDLREIGPRYEWIVAKVRIFDFAVAVRLLGESGPELRFTLNEESYLVLSRDLVTCRDDPEPGLLGEYALGYAFIKSPSSSVLAYGPGRFEAAIEVIRFRVSASGEIRVHMVFVANRPSSIARVSIDPIDWAIGGADLLSGGAVSAWLRPVRDLLDRRPFRLGTFDPVYSYVAAANLLTGDEAARQLCISRDALDKQFLVQHFRQHYQAIVGSLLTWRQISDWTDEAALPAWVVQGHSA